MGDRQRPEGVRGYPRTGGRQRLELRIVGPETEARRALRRLLEGDAAIELSLLWGAEGNGPAGRAGGQTASYLRRLPVRQSSSSVLYLQIDRIDWIEAANQYVRLVVGEHSYLLRESMRRLEARLDPARFVRIHRSAIVNLEQVRELRTGSASERWAVLQDGRRLRVSPGCWTALQEALQWVF